MTFETILRDLRTLGISIAAHGDNLRFHPRSVVGTELLDRMRLHKAELLRLIRGDGDTTAEPLGPDGWPVDCIDPDELTPCPKCGMLELWQSAAGDLFGLTPGRWRCMKCDPPTAARRLAEAAERILRRTNRRTTTRQNG